MDIIDKLIDVMDDKKLNRIYLKDGEFEFEAEKINETTYFSKNEGIINEEKKPLINNLSLKSKPTKEDILGSIIKSPIVGTFYISAGEGKKPFIEVGTSVKIGQTLCIIESMKIMNEIQSQFDGIVEKIFIENGESIEYGQSIVSIK
ncbi:MAG: acetyl-CoA carboxylase, biotin carboxyl carrier protein [Oscillospiraceae bacterium]|nr:acetyl-CoA carboxylase, biotin carboxyl carrier protein [Oscillospiraceae bacterium]